MELMAECLGKWPAFLTQESPWSASSSTLLPQQAFRAFKIVGTCLEDNCNTELIRAQQVPKP